MDMDMEGELILITKGAADCEVSNMCCVHCNVFCALTFCLIPHKCLLYGGRCRLVHPYLHWQRVEPDYQHVVLTATLDRRSRLNVC